jgi:CheY-like chemotaxis protein
VWPRRLRNIVPKILVADDNTNIQKMVTLAFQDRGVDVITVGNGEAAVRRLPDLHPDIVLADVFMPVRNGYEVCEFVKKDERFSHIPVILLVGAFDPLDEKEARRVGADGVLKKPFVPPDPLIAMVMSALEKNPKVAAELAKAREVIVEPAPPMPELEIPAKTEPKPLPDYPEPTAEEAAQIYGFGKGVRALDDEPEADGSKSPAFKMGHEKDKDEEFDGSATASDWRRSAADFEVPDEAGGKLAFADDEDFSPTFPSERDVPPRHIRVQEPAEEIEPVVAESNSAPATSTVAAISAAVNEAIAVSASQSRETQVENSPEPETQQQPDYVPSHAAQEVEAAEAPTVEAPAVEAEAKPESGFLSKAAHWMDMMAPAPAENSNGGWMANLLGLRKEPEVAHAPPAPYAPQDASEPPVEAPIEAKSEPVVEAKVEEAEPAQPSYSENHSADESENVEPSVPTEQSENAPSHTSEPSFAPLRRVFEAAPESSFGKGTASEPVASSSAISAPQTDEFEREPEDAEPSLRDPMLVESPAVHVEPEPLLVNEEVSGPSEYGKRPEHMSPLHSFFSPASGDPVVEEPTAAESSERAEFPTIEPVPVEAAADEFDERIPTVPPPNREALAAIPFLTPPVPTPQEIHSEESSAQQGSAASDDRTVDDLVRKVLEKLQPQLQQMLSQGVLKPLVENMLQSELAKKDK